MRASLRAATTIALVLFLVLVSAAWASFDLKPLPPAERGAASPLALGIVHDSAALDGHVPSGGLRLQALRVYGFKPFGLEQADFVGASVRVGIGPRLEMQVSYHGLNVLQYTEQIYRLSCTLKMGSLGFEPAVRLGTVSQDHTMIDRALLLDFRLRAHAARDLTVLFGTRNPFALGLKRSSERCPTDVTAGVGYRVCDHLNFGLEVVKEGGFPTCVSTGAEIRVVGSTFLRTGLRTEPREFCLGLGLKIRGVALDVSTALHLDLGVTHEAGITYRPGWERREVIPRSHSK
jgi:hypothetical protein